jgi:hypothetical protein
VITQQLQPHDVREVGVTDFALSALAAVPDTRVEEPEKTEKVFTIWLQGEAAAPPLVKACIRSIRRNWDAQQLLVLDEHSIYEYMDLPAVIMDKRRKGKIGHAHFTDIVRLELLRNHGGYWLDATGFATAPIPRWIEKQDFLVHLNIGVIRPHTFMDNSFIRAKRGSWLLEGWRAVMHDYWAKEDGALTYFMHQLMFKAMVLQDPRGAEHFARMARTDLGPTHQIWWGFGREPFDAEVFDSETAGACWQKMANNTWWGQNPPPGSVADEMINKMYL